MSKKTKIKDTRTPRERQIDNELLHLSHKHKPRRPPPSRELHVGRRVRYGNLAYAEVEAVIEDGLAAILKVWDDRPNRRPESLEMFGTPDEPAYRVVLWPEVMPIVEKPAEPVRDTSSIDIWRKCSSRSSTLDALIHTAQWRGLNDTPGYQRGYVWTDEDRARLLESIFQGIDIGKFVIVSHPYPENRMEVLDGKQRLSAIIDFIESRYPYRGVYYHELDWMDRLTLNQHGVQWIEVKSENMKRSELLRLFLAVNAGGVPQTSDHLDEVRRMYDEALKEDALKEGAIR